MSNKIAHMFDIATGNEGVTVDHDDPENLSTVFTRTYDVVAPPIKRYSVGLPLKGDLTNAAYDLGVDNDDVCDHVFKL